MWSQNFKYYNLWEYNFDDKIKDFAIELAKYNLDLPFVGFEFDKNKIFLFIQ
mgnify:CR=1 FL=1